MNGVRTFVAWWLAELGGMVPRGLLRAFGLLPPVLALRCEGDRLAVEFRPGARGARTESVALDTAGPEALREAVRRVLGGVAPGKVSVELIVDQSRALQRTVRVPRAASREIAGVVTFEIERHTPYRADEVIHAWSVDPAAGDEQTIAVDLVMAPREIVSRLVAAAEQSGLRPDAVRVATGAHSLADLPPTAVGAAPAPAGGVLRGLALSAVALGLVAAGAPLLRQKQVLSGLEAAVEQAKARALAADRQGTAAARLGDALQGVVAAKRAAPPVTRMLDALSASLPDGTWLYHVSVLDDEVVIEGMTDRSTSLVKLLEGSPLFRSVRYNAPVTRERGGRVERFSFALTPAGRGAR